MMNDVDVLTRARALIASPENWCQGYYAKDINGRWCEATADQAHCFCALGALIHVDKTSNAVVWLHSVLPRTCQSIPKFNDENTHAAILSLFDKAIKKAAGHDNKGRTR